MKTSLKHIFISACFALIISGVPGTALGQTNDDEYRAYLLALIELLQQQIATLEAQNENTEPVIVSTDDFESFVFVDADNVEARYLLNNPRSVTTIDNDTHRTFFTRFFDIVPEAYDSYFIDLVVYDDRSSEFEGFVETVPPYRADTWRFGINDIMFEFDANSRETIELFIHEFSHVVSYQGIPGRTEPDNITCPEIYGEFGCPPDSSYLTDFTEEFWRERDLEELLEVEERELIWTKSEVRDNFVSEYAASHPAEDFAESFTVFVLARRPSGDSVPEQKVEYFYQFDELVDLREQIRARL